MSSFRLRKGGMVMRTTFRRKKRSSRNFPSRTSCSRFLFVAAIRRTSARNVWLPPTRSNARSSLITRSNLTCVLGSISDTSSRKSVPPLACSNRPMRRSCAPVNAPFSCPNNSLSSNCGESAAQCTTTNFALLRRRIAPNVFESVTLIDLLTERAIFLLEFASLHRARDQHFDLVEIKRLGNKIVGAAFHRFDRDVDRAISSHHDADGSPRHFQSAIDQLHSVVATEAQIGQEHLDLLAFEDVHRASDISSDIHIVIVLQQPPEPIARMLLVIDDEDGGLKIH